MMTIGKLIYRLLDAGGQLTLMSLLVIPMAANENFVPGIWMIWLFIVPLIAASFYFLFTVQLTLKQKKTSS